MPKTREINEIKNGIVVRRHPSIRKAAETLGISWRGIGQVLSGRSKHCNGYVFEYYETNIDGEQWRDHPDGFKVSDHGRIEYPTGKRTYGTKSFHGYMYLHFKSKKQRIHRLVLELFAGPPPLNHEADHIDRNRANNHISNLRWVTSRENQNNRSNNLRLGHH